MLPEKGGTGASMVDEQPLRLGEAARRTGVSADTLRRWIRAGHVEYVQLPSGERRIPEGEVERVLTRHREAHGGSSGAS